jgi:hypothetical protein
MNSTYERFLTQRARNKLAEEKAHRKASTPLHIRAYRKITKNRTPATINNELRRKKNELREINSRIRNTISGTNNPRNARKSLLENKQKSSNLTNKERVELNAYREENQRALVNRALNGINGLSNMSPNESRILNLEMIDLEHGLTNEQRIEKEQLKRKIARNKAIKEGKNMSAYNEHILNKNRQYELLTKELMGNNLSRNEKAELNILTNKIENYEVMNMGISIPKSRGLDKIISQFANPYNNEELTRIMKELEAEKRRGGKKRITKLKSKSKSVKKI